MSSVPDLLFATGSKVITFFFCVFLVLFSFLKLLLTISLISSSVPAILFRLTPNASHDFRSASESQYHTDQSTSSRPSVSRVSLYRVCGVALDKFLSHFCVLFSALVPLRTGIDIPPLVLVFHMRNTRSNTSHTTFRT